MPTKTVEPTAVEVQQITPALSALEQESLAIREAEAAAKIKRETEAAAPFRAELSLARQYAREWELFNREHKDWVDRTVGLAWPAIRLRLVDEPGIAEKCANEGREFVGIRERAGMAQRQAKELSEHMRLGPHSASRVIEVFVGLTSSAKQGHATTGVAAAEGRLALKRNGESLDFCRKLVVSLRERLQILNVALANGGSAEQTGQLIEHVKHVRLGADEGPASYAADVRFATGYEPGEQAKLEYEAKLAGEAL